MQEQPGPPGAQQQSQLGARMVNLMPTPPAVITDKDHMYLKDALSWELLAMKKCHHWAGMCQDQEIAGLMNRVGWMHQQHYLRLLAAVDPQKTLM